MSRRSLSTTIELDSPTLAALLSRLDCDAAGRSPNAKGRPTRRAHHRIQFRQMSVPIRIEHPGGGAVELLVCTRNISAGGLAFLHGGYVHRGSRCTVLLPTLDGRRQALVGTVAGGRLVEGRIHEFGVAFEQKVDPSRFVQPDVIADIVKDELTEARAKEQQEFFARVGHAGVQLAKVVEPPRLIMARSVCRELSDRSRRLGFETLAAAAEATLAGLEASASVARSAGLLVRLRRMCELVAQRSLD